MQLRIQSRPQKPLSNNKNPERKLPSNANTKTANHQNTYLFGTVRCTRSGNQRGAVAHHGGILHENTLWKSFVRWQLDDIQAKFSQKSDVRFVLFLRFLQFYLSSGSQRQWYSAYNCVCIPNRHVDRHNTTTRLELLSNRLHTRSGAGTR